jgi:asparagine synthase (glutamine-hydrolysing)
MANPRVARNWISSDQLDEAERKSTDSLLQEAVLPVVFATPVDTEVVLRLLEQEGPEALHRLNGQFALAWWQPRERRLTLARDRFGVRPLHYSPRDDGSLVFGSEAKALFASGEVSPSPDPAGIDDVFTLWGPRAPRTAFREVRQVLPGGLLVWERGRIVEERRWWSPDYGVGGGASDDFDGLMRDSVRLRLRADVPVGTYLSGGLDSSLITALAQAETDGQLRTFSVAFKDPRYDERSHQEEVARAIGTQHHVVEAGPVEIATALPEVVWHAETPLVRTAPVPLFLLAKEVRAHDLTVVATGEGADELFWGYDLFKEVVLREIYTGEPGRALQLLEGLYTHLGPSAGRRGPAWQRFLMETGAGDAELGSHLTRAEATAAVKAFYSEEMAAAIGERDSLDSLRADLPLSFSGWSPLERAAWLELTTLLEPYLLASQGDRVAMGAWGGGPLSVPRPSCLRSLRGPAAGAQAADRPDPRQDRASRPGGQSAAGRNRRARKAALPGAGGRAVLRPRRAGVGGGAALACRARTGGVLGFAKGRGPAAPLSSGPGDGHPRGHGLRRHSVRPALASCFRSNGRGCLSTRNGQAASEDRSHGSAHHRGGVMTKTKEDVKSATRAYVEENFLYMHPGVELDVVTGLLGEGSRRFASLRRGTGHESPPACATDPPSTDIEIH